MNTIRKTSENEKLYLIRFSYELDVRISSSIQSIHEETCLVYARSYMKACEKIIKKYKNASKFHNLTISNL